jgi:hypothetical protein
MRAKVIKHSRNQRGFVEKWHTLVFFEQIRILPCVACPAVHFPRLFLVVRAGFCVRKGASVHTVPG